jgi:phosphatidylserine/phosphatidylglycerophosphate/cardiolipin synthase-like enzyme
VKEIYEQISRMLKEAKKIIRISSPFIDVFYDEIANLLDEKPGLVIKIIARPKSDIAGPREKIAKNAIEQLNKSTGGNVVTSKLVHSRLIIIDEDEMLVSSADLTRDSLFDEFNSGIWTRDKEAIGEATEFFDNLYEYCKESQKRPSNGGLD